MRAKQDHALTQENFDAVTNFLQKYNDTIPVSYENIKAVATAQGNNNTIQTPVGCTQHDLIVPDIGEFLSSFQNPGILTQMPRLQQYFQHFSPTNPKPGILENVTVIQKSPTHS